MNQKLWGEIPVWSLATPVGGCVLLAATYGGHWGWPILLVAALVLIGSILVSVYHAEVIAHRVGEPLGTLVLALAVTIIEVSLIVSMMLSGGPSATELARDTVFATVMIICNGVIGICLLAGSSRHHVITFRAEGTIPSLAVLATLTTLTLVLPGLTTTTPGPYFSKSQLIFAGVVSLVLYGMFLFVQTVRHRDYFLPKGNSSEEAHAPPPSRRAAGISFVLLVVALVAVVGLAKVLSPSIESGIATAGLPKAVVGIAIAMIVLLPETWAAARAAVNNRMQTSFNLALGSALATIGLTIPAVGMTSILMGVPLKLGMGPKEIALLSITLVVSTLTLIGGRATVLQGCIHLVLFGVYLFLAMVP